jgi:hypothetical protein
VICKIKASLVGLIFVFLSPSVHALLCSKISQRVERKIIPIRSADQQNRSTKTSFRSASDMKMYFILLRAMKHSGDVFVEIERKLSDFEKMGVNTLWLSPPQPQTAAGPPMFALNDHGYWPSSHADLDPRLGSEANFRKLVQSAKTRGIEVAIDAVLNHFGYADVVQLNNQMVSTSDRSRFVVIDNVASTYHRHGELNAQIEQASSGNEILRLREELSQYPLYDLPTLRKDVPANVDYLIDSFKKFVDRGVTVFRVDAAKHMPHDFLVKFSNEINAYSLAKWRKPAKFIWEAYITRSEALSLFADASTQAMRDPDHTYFYDFPMREEFKRVQDPEYRFDWLKGFVQYRLKTRQPIDKFIPLVEDHDNGTAFPKRFTARLVYALSDFFSENSPFLFHGSEQTGARKADRPVISGFQPEGDVSKILAAVGRVISPYRVHAQEKIYFHETDQNLLTAERRIPQSKSLFLAANKGTTKRKTTISLKDIFPNDQYKIEKIFSSGFHQISYDKINEELSIELNPESMVSLEVSLK